ncbi:hypothetical protein HYU06_04025 [Candidatus Woesearchaeota archaeon]|nr:hypothetical protein [Candidatus Woesearchaeota archaeon]
MVTLVKDSMVLIHLAKITLLETACNYFDRIIISERVYQETTLKNQYEDAVIIRDIIGKKLIEIRKADKELVAKANDFNLHGGEAETTALYWQLKADLIASDDDNLRKKREVLDLKVIGTLTIILKLYQKKKITKEKYLSAITKLKEIGWFHVSVLDKLLEE